MRWLYILRRPSAQDFSAVTLPTGKPTCMTGAGLSGHCYPAGFAGDRRMPSSVQEVDGLRSGKADAEREPVEWRAMSEAALRLA